MSWPQIKIVKHCLQGFREVLKTEGGVTFMGLRSSRPWICWNGQFVVCERCGEASSNPPPIELDPEKHVAVPTGGMVHAQHVLAALLHPFYKAHKDCKRQEVAA